jgi:ABC-type phosphate transport system ATPase subunit
MFKEGNWRRGHKGTAIQTCFKGNLALSSLKGVVLLSQLQSVCMCRAVLMSPLVLLVNEKTQIDMYPIWITSA